MDDIRIIKVKQSVFANNNSRAEEVRKKLKEKHVYLVNVMSSPGSGKTTFLVSLINRLKKDLRIGVMEADIDATVDAETISSETGVRSVQIHTSGECHLDAKMVDDSLEGFGIDDLDLVFLENIGNLVCPAEFDTGATSSFELLSIPEGDDKPLKYPLMFTVANVVIFTKMDAISVFDFDLKKAEERILKLNPNARFFPVSAKTGEGIDKIAQYLLDEVKKYQAK
ncbi:MAG TPA: hydrogenase accessory protein HypB [Firmicutes bacterium]|nr:hydrogenase accessory protein HypB [Bacillota bacterium]HBN00406.1 hydrogenase accessory protein HypB [Bacillota bacterium]